MPAVYLITGPMAAGTSTVAGLPASGRAHKGYGTWSVEQLYAGFVEATPRTGIWLDTRGETPEETVDAILARTDAAIVGDS